MNTVYILKKKKKKERRAGFQMRNSNRCHTCVAHTCRTHVSHTVSRNVKYDTSSALQCTIKPWDVWRLCAGVWRHKWAKSLGEFFPPKILLIKEKLYDQVSKKAIMCVKSKNNFISFLMWLRNYFQSHIFHYFSFFFSFLLQIKSFDTFSSPLAFI